MQEIEEEEKKQFNLSFPAVDLLNKKYSLEADIITGWKPKFKVLGPIPFNFDSAITDEVIDELTSFGQKHKERVIYLGYRYANSFKLHQEMDHEYRYKHEGIINSSFSHMAAYFRKFHANFKSKSAAGRLFKGMNPTLKPEEEVIFNSNFQSGNLDAAIKVAQNQYDLFMRVDTNTRGHVQWFNFTIKNNGKHKIKLNIVNFRKFKTLYNRGMKPYLYSDHAKQTKNIGWIQGGQNVKFERQKLRYRFLEDNFFDETITYNCLKFQYTFETNWQTVKFAYCPPFTYSQMLTTVKNLKKNGQLITKNFIYEQILCESVGGLDIPLLTITDPEIDDKKKKCVLVWARIHPGQTCGSHMNNGFLKYICSNSEIAQQLRKRVVFKVIPMLNPDGVIAGNFRTSFCGKDLNRQFRTNYSFLIPQIKAVKDLVIKLRNEFKSRLIFFLDMHGHSVKKNVFLYGPQYEIWIFPKIISEKTQVFRYYSCMFRIADFKRTTARAVLLNNIPHCYTIQASTGIFYSRQEKKDINFTPESWETMGRQIAESIYDYIMLIYDAQLTKQQRSQKINDLKTVKTKKSSQSRTNNQRAQNRLLSVNSTQKHKNTQRKEIQVQNLNEKTRQMIEDIKKNEKNKVQEHQSDNYSEGGSDSEGTEDDIPEEELQQLHKQIIDSMKQFRDKFYNSTKDKEIRSSNKKIVRQSMKLRQSRESRGIQMIASLRKKAEQLERAQNMLMGRKIKNQMKSKTTNLERMNLQKSEFPFIQNHKLKISYQTYMRQYSKNKDERSSPLL